MPRITGVVTEKIGRNWKIREEENGDKNHKIMHPILNKRAFSIFVELDFFSHT